MALNPSGPISLGGPTVGQSINLELGNAATALASINSTPFRTLAGVPSGLISLSNFYGKSSESSWILCFGYTTTCYPLQISTGAPEGTFIGNAGWDVAPNGLMAIPSAGPVNGSYGHRTLAVRWVDSTGATTGSIRLTPTDVIGSNKIRAIVPTFQGSSSYYMSVDHFFYYQNAISFGATSSNTYLWSQWKRVQKFDSEFSDGARGIPVSTDSSNNFFLRIFDNTKYGRLLHSAKVSSAGTALNSMTYYIRSPIDTVVTRSNGQIIGFGYSNTSSGGYDGSSWYLFPSSYNPLAVIYTSLYQSSTPGGIFYYTTFDNVNNIMWTYGRYDTGNNTQGGVIRFRADSYPDVYVSYREDLTGFGMFPNAQTFDGGLSYSSGNLYIAAFNTSTQRIYIARINPTTLAPIWCVSLDFTNGSGTSQNIASTNYFGVYAPLIKASSVGVHAVFTLGSNVDGGSGFALKILSSGISAGTYTVPANGTNFTLTVRTVTLTATSRTIPTVVADVRNNNTDGNPSDYNEGTTVATSTPTVNPTFVTI